MNKKLLLVIISLFLVPLIVLMLVFSGINDGNFISAQIDEDSYPIGGSVAPPTWESCNGASCGECSSSCSSCSGDNISCSCTCKPGEVIDPYCEGGGGSCPGGYDASSCGGGSTGCNPQPPSGEPGDPENEPGDPECVNKYTVVNNVDPGIDELVAGDVNFSWEVESWGLNCNLENTEKHYEIYISISGENDFSMIGYVDEDDDAGDDATGLLTYQYDTNLDDDLEFLQLGESYDWYVLAVNGDTFSEEIYTTFTMGGRIYGDVWLDNDFPGCEGGYEEAPATGIDWTVSCNVGGTAVEARRNLTYSALPDSGSKIADNSSDQSASFLARFLRPFLGFIGQAGGNYLTVRDNLLGLFGFGALAAAPPPPPPPPRGECSVYADWDKGEVSIRANTPGTFEWSIENDGEVYSGSQSIGLPSVWESDIKSRYWQIQDGGLRTLRAYCKFTPVGVGIGDEEDTEYNDILCSQPAYTCLNEETGEDILPYTEGVPYNVSIENIEDGYESNTCDSNPALEPDSQGSTFILSLSYNQWWQVEGGDIYAEGSEITSNIPSTAALPYLMLNKISDPIANHGVVSQALGSLDIDEAEGVADDGRNWEAVTGLYLAKQYNYGFWKNYLSSELTDWGGGSSPVSDVWESTVDGSLDIGVDDWSLGTAEEQQIFILHDGNVNIRGNIEISLGSSLVVVASGNIYIYPNVTRADGYYISDGAINVMGRLEVQGGLTAYGENGIIMPAVDVDSDDEPVFKFIFRPDIYMNLPDELKVKRIEEWIEIAP